MGDWCGSASIRLGAGAWAAAAAAAAAAGRKQSRALDASWDAS